METIVERSDSMTFTNGPAVHRTNALSRIEQDFAIDGFCALLYYHYTPIADPFAACAQQQSICEELELFGRIRVSVEGINGTLTGAAEGVMKYIAHMESASLGFCTKGIQWKISGAIDSVPVEKQRFNKLSVKVTKEVVSLDLTEEEKAAAVEAGAGYHLSPQQFHAALSSRRSDLSLPPALQSGGKELVLVDVRNAYETEIGKFEYHSSDGKSHLAKDPRTRTFSDFKHFVTGHLDELRDKNVLMYCTGGVRCELASAYMKAKGVESVFQLAGGIHCYQEAFPSGGLFRGKNFVYDPRIAVPYKEKDEVVGRCRKCSDLHDDYSPQIRCRQCRMLQLVCERCRESNSDFLENGVLCIICESRSCAANNTMIAI